MKYVRVSLVFRLASIALAAALLPVVPTFAQVKHYPLESTDGLRLHNVNAEVVTHQGGKGLRLTLSEEAKRQPVEQLAILKDLSFGDGVIEVEVAGAPAPDAPEGARGFVGIAFRLQPDDATYDAFYLRPTNGRAEDQERRNRSVQYISHPAWTWSRLRQETPAKYEAYVDLVPGAWTKVKVEVHGAQGRLFVHDGTQPTLIVNDLKTEAHGRGGVALWIGPGTVGHFRSLTVKTTASR